MKIFLTGDNHIGLAKKNKDIYENRINVFENMVNEANNEKCDLFVISGDLFEDNNSHKKDLKKVLDLLREFNNTVVILPGNHDYYDAESDLWSEFNTLQPKYNNVLLLKEYKEYKVKCGDNDVSLLPALCKSNHSKKGENNIGWISDLDFKDDCSFRIGIAHGVVEGEAIDTEGEYFSMSRKELDKMPIDLWLIGHTHVPFPNDLTDKLISVNDRIFNAGTHVQTDVNCNTEGNCFIIEIADDKTIKAKKYISGNLFYKRIKINIKPGELKQSLESELKKYDKNTIIDLILEGTLENNEYEERKNIIEDVLDSFNENSTYSTVNISRFITKEYINSNYVETSFSAKLLTALLDNPKETQLMDELLQTLKEGK